MGSIEYVIWTLAIFSGLLFLATVAYAIVTYKMFKSSRDQIKALNELTNAVLQLPHMFKNIEDQKELEERRIKEQVKIRRRILGEEY